MRTHRNTQPQIHLYFIGHLRELTLLLSLIFCALLTKMIRVYYVFSSVSFHSSASWQTFRMANEVFREMQCMCAGAWVYFFVGYCFFSLFLKGKQDFPFTPFPLSPFRSRCVFVVFEQALVNDISFFIHSICEIMSECTHIRPLFWWWRFLFFFLVSYFMLRVVVSRCLCMVKGVDVCVSTH